MSDAQEVDRRTLAFVALGLAALVLVSLAHAAYRFSRVSVLERAPAEIVEIEERTGTGSRSSTQRVPVAVLTLRSGDSLRVTLEASSNSPFCCDVGERVDVLYDPADVRGTALADRFADLYGPQLAFAAVGSLFLFVVAGSLRSGRRG